ncbi:hypothetical protein [Gluconobacter japonicus]|uniref:hypothetical protein n=1 Tax=Gluconobacter japonicus TaxID=376620 RepID=UPI0039EABA1C
MNAVETLKSAAVNTVYELPHRFPEVQQAVIALLVRSSDQATVEDVLTGIMTVGPVWNEDAERRTVLKRFFARLPQDALGQDVRSEISQDFDEDAVEPLVSDLIRGEAETMRKGGFTLSASEAVAFAEHLDGIAEQARKMEASLREFEREVLCERRLTAADVVDIRNLFSGERA